MFEGGIDGFLLETMNYWDEALMALEGVELFFRKVKAAKNSNFGNTGLQSPQRSAKPIASIHHTAQCP